MASLPTAPVAQTAPESARRWLALACIALGQLMLALDATIMNVALPTVERALGFSAALRPWVISAYLLPFAVLLLPAGRLADALGQKRAFLIGALGFAAASALGGAAAVPPALVAARALQGAFAALLAPSALSLVAVCFRAPGERSRAFAVYGAVAACGGALGLVLGGLLTRFADWRWCLYVNVAIALGSSLGVSTLLDAPPRAPRRDDWLRTLRALWADRTRRVATSVAALAVAAMSGAFLLLTYHYQRVRGLTALDTGLAFLPLSLGGMLGSSLVARRLSARMAPRHLVAGALSCAALGLLLLSRAGAASPYLWHLAPAELLLGLGIGSAMMPVFSLATLGVEPHNAGLASALVSAAQQLGGAIGAALLNALALAAGYGLAACGGAVLLAAAALCAWGLAPPGEPLRAARAGS
ncbi:MAG TPA: MFS transporter [Polyangiaceae bacterium]|nr:MFS transporter [Polyangiaceae bacterium]